MADLIKPINAIKREIIPEYIAKGMRASMLETTKSAPKSLLKPEPITTYATFPQLPPPKQPPTTGCTYQINGKRLNLYA